MHMDSLVRSLSGNLSVSAISACISDEMRRFKGGKNCRSALLNLLQNYKSRGNYGHLSTALIMSLLLEGYEFLSDVEAKGVLLCDETVERKFYEMLKRIRKSLSEFDSDGPLIVKRVETYINFCELTMIAAEKIERLKNYLRTRSMSVIKGLLGLAELHFLKEHLHLEPSTCSEISHLLEVSKTSEEFAAITSLLLWKANKIVPLRGEEFEGPIHDELLSPSFRETVENGRILNNLNDIGKLLSCFGYHLVKIRSGGAEIFKVIPSTPDFEFFLRLGYIRDEISRPVQFVEATTEVQSPLLGMDVATRYMIENSEDLFTEWATYPYPRLKIKLPCHPDMYRSLLGFVYFDDIHYAQRIRDDYLMEPNSDVPLSGGLNTNDFMKVGKALRFLTLLMANAICHNSDKHGKVSFNSLVRVVIEQQYIKEIAAAFGIDEELLSRFVRLLSWNAEEGSYCDLQYRPFIRIGGKLVLLPALFASSNMFRNIHVSHKVSRKGQGSTFVMICTRLLEERFERVASERRIKGTGKNTEVDIVVWYGKTLYLFECKYSLPPCDYQEIRDIWRDILKGVSQMRIAREILSDAKKRHSYLAGWFPGISSTDTDDIEIRTCVLHSNRLFAGMGVEGVPVRDFYSFSAIMTEYVMSFGIAEPGQESNRVRYSVVQGGKFSPADLDDYLKDDARYYRMFSENMRPFTEFEAVIPGKLVIAWERFVYSVDYNMENHIRSMDSLGFYRLPDEQVLVNFPISKDALKSQRKETAGY